MSTTQTSYRKQRLSKSDYLAGLQCPKHLWLRINEPDAPQLLADDNLEALFEQGRRVGALARQYVPGGKLIDHPYYAIDKKLRDTQQALEEGCDIIYEAAFVAGNQFVAVDILQRIADGFIIIEVKSSTSVKDEHLQELALQANILQECGIRVVKCEVMHINRECVYPDLSNLFVREDVTESVSPLVEKVSLERGRHTEILSGSLPTIQIGPHCLGPRECAFKELCWSDVPEHHVTTLYRLSAKKAFELVEQGAETIQQIPADHKLSAIAERQRRAVLENRPLIEDNLTDALQAFGGSLGFLDFETVSLAVPVWDGCRPYDAVPVQFSFCKLKDDGSLTHSEWLAEGPEDPREELALALIQACDGVDVIAAYNSQFEAKALNHLAAALPHLAEQLGSIKDRLVDLLPVIREHVYHPQFYGGFGLKQVLPALLDEQTYEELDIADGNTASWLLQSLLLGNERTPDETAELREQLKNYCKADTESLAKLFIHLKRLSE